VALVAPRTVRLIGVDEATLQMWSQRGITKIAPEEAAWMQASESDVEQIQARLRPAVRADNEGYELTGPAVFSDDEHRPRLR
jgi:hypothetical protein